MNIVVLIAWRLFGALLVELAFLPLMPDDLKVDAGVVFIAVLALTAFSLIFVGRGFSFPFYTILPFADLMFKYGVLGIRVDQLRKMLLIGVGAGAMLFLVVLYLSRKKW